MDQTHKIKPLPRPTSTSEIYLAFILDALEDIKDGLGQSPPVEYSVEVDPKVIVLKEPEKQKPVSTPLPADFPGKEALEEAGIIYLETVPRTGAELTSINGVGVVTANKILTWFAS